MMIRQTLLAAISILPFVFSGCSFLQPAQPLTPEQKLHLVNNIARAGTASAILQVHKKDVAAQNVAARKIISVVDNNIMKVITDDGVVLDPNVDVQLLKFIPVEYRSLLLVAVDTFHLYYGSPAGKLTPEQVAMLRAFFSGVRTGAYDVLLVNGAND